MLAIDYSTLDANLEDYCNRAADDAETVVVTRRDKKNIVMMSQDAYENLMENIFLMSNQANYRHILEGIRQLEANNVVVKNADDLERLADE